MSEVMDYRERAAKCVELAAQISDPICKAAFLEMARSWAHLAEQADKNATLGFFGFKLAAGMSY